MTRHVVRQFFEAHVMEPSEGCRIWPYSTTGFGYGQVWVDGRRRDVHELTCQHWHGPKPTPKHEAAHSCRTPGCWAGEHLRWATSKENAADMTQHGTSLRGAKNVAVKLTEDDVRTIRQRIADGDVQYRIAKDYGVSKQTITNIKNGKNWGWLH